MRIWSIPVSDFKEKMKQDFILIDIRTFAEIKEAKIEWTNLELDFYNDQFKNEISKLDINKKYLLYCRSGARTWMALTMMEGLWFKEVYYLEGWLIMWVNKWEELVK